MTDSSLGKNDSVWLYLSTHDANPERIYSLNPDIPSLDDIETWLKMDEKKDRMAMKRLKAMTMPHLEYDLVIMLMKSKNRDPFFKIVDTVFWLPGSILSQLR